MKQAFSNIYWFFRYYFTELFKALKSISKPIFAMAIMVGLCYLDWFRYDGRHIIYFAVALFAILLYDIYRRMDWVAFKRKETEKRLGFHRYNKKDFTKSICNRGFACDACPDVLTCKER